MGDGCPLLDDRCMIRDIAVKRSMENMISAIASVDLFSLLIGKEDACLPEAGRTETPKYQFGTNHILVFFAYWQSSG